MPNEKDPPLQNIPVRTDIGRQLRDAFTPPPGRAVQDIDYSSTELRIMEQLANGGDIHREVAEWSRPLVDALGVKERLEKMTRELEANMDRARDLADSLPTKRKPLTDAERRIRKAKSKAAKKARKANR